MLMLWQGPWHLGKVYQKICEDLTSRGYTMCSFLEGQGQGNGQGQGKGQSLSQGHGCWPFHRDKVS